ncbi:Ger(x)C family spore germination protein [Hathewaya massiliensis]|uniref:Ger(x)C family spore germination protein n=1 Tax=Hathewaya massiliensis TaxID=1964382 RepID=UPI00163C5D31|nr:Ger(x)C family spore germination protein [Hathewaya massiliensis]
MKRKFRFTCFLLAISFILTGCWDKTEIDRRAFISTISIDPGEEIGKSQELKGIKEDEIFQERQIKKINVTYSFPDISSLGPNVSGTSAEKTIKTQSYSMEGSISEATSKSSRSIHLGHSKMLVLSDAMFSYPEVVKEIVDYFRRNPTINRSMNVVVAEGNAEDYEKFKPSMEQNFQSYINGLMENSDKNSTIIPMTLNELLKLLEENGNAIIPYIKMNKKENEVSVYGIALIKNYELIGVLNSIETSDVEILRGKAKGGTKVIYKEGHPINYSIEGIERKLRVTEINEKKLKMDIDINLEGSAKSFTVDKKLLSSKVLAEYEKNFDKTLSMECNKILKVIQEKYNIEPFAIKEYLEKYHPYKWKKVQGNWEEIYKNAEFNVNIKTKIRRIGITQ